MNKGLYENDKPETKQDYLDYKIFAQILKNSLEIIPTQLGFTCALDGIWGIGKTTLLNFLKEEIKKDKNFKYQIIDFSPWNLIDAQKSINEFFALLKKTVYENDPNTKINKYIAQYYKIIIEGVKLIPSVNKFSGIFDFIFNLHNSKKDKTLSSVKEDLYNYMKYDYVGKDLLIIIDDVDRLTGPEIMMLMKLIKEIADFPHITYLLSLDKNNVANAINHFSNYTEDNQYGYNYLDKFVQLWWTVPYISSDKIIDYLTEKIKNIVPANIFDYEENYYYTICKNIIFYRDDITLRKIKLLFNSFANNYEKMKNYTNFCDLLAFTWIQLFYPDLITIIVQNYDLLLENKRTIDGLGLSDKEKYDEEQKQIDKNKNRFNSLQISKEYLHILWTLFPLLKYNLGKSYAENRKDNDIMRLLISTEENFSNYIYQKQSEFVEILRNIEIIVKSTDTELVIKSLKENKENLHNYLDYIYLYYCYKNSDINLITLISSFLLFGNTLNEKESSYIIGSILNFITPNNKNSLLILIDIINNYFFKINHFLIVFLNSMIVSQGLLYGFDTIQKKQLTDSFYSQLSKYDFMNENMIYYRRILNIFSKSKRSDIIKKLFMLKTEFIIANIIQTYEEMCNRNGSNITFNTFFAYNTSGYQFTLQNFWNYTNKELSSDMVSNSSKIKKFQQSSEFSKLEQKDKYIIETYLREFNI